MNHQKSIDSYRRDGIVVVPGFLSTEELQILRAQLGRYIQVVVPELPDSDAFFQDKQRPETLKQMQHIQDEELNAYRVHPKWKSLAEALIGEPAEGLPPEWFNKPPGVDHPTPPHQDNFYFCLHPANVTTFWVALDAVDEQNGCLRYVLGSHLEGIRDHTVTKVLGFSQGISDYCDEDRNREQVVSLQAGDLVAHHGNMIHRAEPNRSTDRHRRAFAIVFRGESCRTVSSAQEQKTQRVRQQHQSMGLLVDEGE